MSMILSIQFINRKGIYHRDLKPSNFLIHLDQDKLYLHLNDFGTVKDSNDKNIMSTTLGRNKGTTPYMAPEYLKRDPEKIFDQYEKLDVWAIGVITYYISTLRHPFYNFLTSETE